MNTLFLLAIIPILAIASGIITRAVVGLAILAIFWMVLEKFGLTGLMATIIRWALIIGAVAIVIWLLLGLTGTSLP